MMIVCVNQNLNVKVKVKEHQSLKLHYFMR